ncbi:MAG: LysE family translocator [Thiohalophilus sp.]|uniref:LysE family translocator n=1 Tax=Thiohalophilus sp. TaxID=3028392 RepID=UPI00287001BA|nr:LysE family translocator [Thiohalophilus sp.]MDR9435560.1 LysE family translocator [Thiohalophilus sp.]
MLVLAAVPSISVLAVTARAVTGGFSHAAATTAGIVAGDLVFILLSLFGLAVLFEILDEQFYLIKYLGSAYLIWLGIILWRGNNRMASREPAGNGSLLSSFLAGLLITLGDHKAILFYLGFLPAFVDLGSVTSVEVFQIITITIVAVGGVKLTYAWVAIRAGSLLGASAASVMNRLAAGLLIAIGLFLLVTA